MTAGAKPRGARIGSDFVRVKHPLPTNTIFCGGFGGLWVKQGKKEDFMKKRNWKHEYELQVKRGDVDGFLERQKARRLYDKKKINRSGKDIDHIKPIREGGKTTVGNLRLRSKKANKSDNK